MWNIHWNFLLNKGTTVCVYVDDVISRNWRWANPIMVQKEITCEALESNAVWMAGKNCWCNRCTSVQFHNHTIDQCALIGGVVPLVTVCWMTWTCGQEHKGDVLKKSWNNYVHSCTTTLSWPQSQEIDKNITMSIMIMIVILSCKMYQNDSRIPQIQKENKQTLNILKGA